ncbi:MAG: aspartate/glutamate racemase family protein [Alphaproteobacteria bacterium]|nr:aspartate/glutamate racemase family protein [Alphaproteobacteria bacterium]
MPKRHAADARTKASANPVAMGRGRPVYGASVGILVLDTRFMRFPGDIGNAATWDFPVHYKMVVGATPVRVVDQQGKGLLPAFIAAAEELIALGCDGITTTCGFLSLFHEPLRDALPVPVCTSSLLQIPMVQSLLPRGKRVGVLTFSKPSLTERHFTSVGVDPTLPVQGLPEGGVFHRSFPAGDHTVPFAAYVPEIMQSARALLKRHPEVGAIVSECTNMPPYSAMIQQELGVPVFDMVNLVRWFQGGLRPRNYGN